MEGGAACGCFAVPKDQGRNRDLETREEIVIWEPGWDPRPETEGDGWD